MLLVVGWDGACFDVVDQFVADGQMPTLAGLLERGNTWRVQSTVPPVTFPAWTSFMTGASPGRHGITDFAVRRPGTYGVRFVNSTHRRLPTIWRLLADAGRSVAVYAMPATYPAEPACTLQVCGFDTPLGSSAGGGSCHPPGLGAQLRARYGGLAVEALPQSRIDDGWHESAASRLLESIRLRTTIVCDLMEERRPDVFAVHYIESDTVAHHFWPFDDPTSPRPRRGPRGVIRDVYRALDEALARLLDAAGSDAVVMLVSDHGSGGASDRVIFWNRWLADSGWLRFEAEGAGAAPRALRKAALRLVPPSLQPRLFGRFPALASRLESRARLSGIDWRRTRAFSDELPYFPSLWLNVRGREPCGTVEPTDLPALLRELEAAAKELRDPFDGEPVVAAVRRREQVFEGPFAHLAPDLLLELRRPGGYSYCAGSSAGGVERRALRRLSQGEMRGAKGGSTGGAHRDFGLMVVAGADGAAPAQRGLCTIADAGVTALELAGVAATSAMDGRSVFAALARCEQSPAAASLRQGVDAEPFDYDAAEEAEVAERLRALGYLS